MEFLTTTEALADACAALATADYVTVDTEFMRETTYWPILCLVQLGGPDDAVLVDPLAEGIDLAPLYALMANPRVLKVFHAARQDIEIFHQRAGYVPTPLFDTQIAAMVCGFGEQASYETLVRRIAKVELDKSSRFTDWRRRPLSERQIAYAAGDVTHLRTVYEALARRLAETGRAAWVAEEMAVLTDPETYAARPEDAWKRLRSRTANRRFLGVLKAVAAWRERLAQERDTPRNRVLRDEALLEIASHPPRSIEDLQALRGVPGGFGNSAWGRTLVEAVLGADELPAAELPPNDRPAPNVGNIGPLVELLRVLLKLRADENEVAQRLIATHADLERIAAEDEADVPALHGWRQEIFGSAALALKGGRIALAASGSQVRTLPLDDEMAAALKPPPPRARSRRRRRTHPETAPAEDTPLSSE